MASAQCRKERFGSYGDQLQVLVAQRQRKNRHIDREVAQTLYQDSSRFFNDAQLRVGEALGETSRIARYQIGRNSWNHTHGDAAAKVCILIGRAGSRCLQLVQNRASAGNESAARLGESYAATQAVEKLG